MAAETSIASKSGSSSLQPVCRVYLVCFY